MLRRRQFVSRDEWTGDQLEQDRQKSIEVFRTERMQEPLEAYLDEFEKFQAVLENLLETTVDLTRLEQEALTILTDSGMQDAFRYLPGPFISSDDLKILVDASSLSPAAFANDTTLAQRLVSTVFAIHDRRRFPWISEQREPTEAEREAAIIATAALMATQRVATNRRAELRKDQVETVRQRLLDYGLTEVTIPAGVRTLNEAPPAGQFAVRTDLSGRKADLIVTLWDGRIMPIECKVSNSSTNSVKRLNNDAAVKAVSWQNDLGEKQVVPAAILSGVYNLRNLIDAQNRGLTIYWAHDIQRLIDWIESTRE